MFLPLADRQVDGRRHITKAELVAVDWAEIPSNRDARAMAVRSLAKPDGGTPASWKTRIAALEVEITLLDLDHPETKSSSMARVYADLAEAQLLLATLNDRR
jgi:hypothetical protein